MPHTVPSPLVLAERDRTAREWLLPWVERHKSLDGAIAVEFGCGAGGYTVALSERVGRVVAVDIDDQAVAVARERLTGAGNVTLKAGSFTRLLEFVAEQTDGVDVFLMPAVLEHMTVQERLAVLRLARRTLRDDGVLVVWETPNRLLWSDHHTSLDPFFHQLPEELAMAWVDRVPREGMADAVRTGGELELWRWGRGVSFHEFEVALGDFEPRIVAGGYDPDTIALRHVDRDELALAGYLSRELPHVHPAFSRYWLDLIISASPVSHRPAWRPRPFQTVDGDAVAVSRWGLLHLLRSGAWVRLDLPQPTDGLLIGIEAGDQPTALAVRDDGWEIAETVRLPGVPSARTEYRVVELSRPSASPALEAVEGSAVASFVAVREN